MVRRLLRGLWPLGIVLVVFAGRVSGCRGKEETGPAAASRSRSATATYQKRAKAGHRGPTPTMIPPPPGVTVIPNTGE
ncbi:MAG: hypothetical protein ABI968_00080 [Acidobacteriota bacterium]